uniref:LIM and calponin homology domains 1b n=1 Tax=Amphilophus citrinellus TaxID=61819 RepID=A0A3Q0SNI2_AMPCI
KYWKQGEMFSLAVHRAVTGRCFGDKDFRGGLENGILLCDIEFSTISCFVFLRGCEELGLKGSQLFDPGDLQDTSTRPTANRKLKNVLITIYWLGRAANSCTSYNGPTLDLKEFEGLLSQMRKVGEPMFSNARGTNIMEISSAWII